MLISKVPESDAGRGEGGTSSEDHSHEYQTASELFELMSKNQNIVSNDVKNLTTQDLVLLYKNLDLGTKLMANVNEIAARRSNQYVETVVYNDPESDDSELSEIYSNEDLQHMFMVNNERIDLLNSEASRANTLCPKLGDLEIRPSHLSDEFDKHFLFNNPCLRKQLKNLNLSTKNTDEFGNTILPASLLDYICTNQLDDNYSFYMENVIRHVQHTIEHLKRISNGDFLTEKAKEKWREVENINKNAHCSNTKVLATSSSIPLHIRRTTGGIASMWNDIVHSAVDIRSLSKILEKRIVVEVPKLVGGSYRFLTKRRRTTMNLFSDDSSDNLIISCKKRKRSVELSHRESRVNVVFQLQRSETGHVMNKVSSIMILETKALAEPMEYLKDVLVEEIPQPLPLDYKLENNNYIEEDNGAKDENATGLQDLSKNEDNVEQEDKLEQEYDVKNLDPKVFFDTDNDAPRDDEGRYLIYEHNLCEKNIDSASDAQTNDECEEYGDMYQTFIDNKITGYNEPYFRVSPIDLRITIPRPTKQAYLDLENEVNEQKFAEANGPPSTTVRKKSPTRARIKSPYENKSLMIEEKKRKKLLEIRERRERKKLALAENCKTKPKYGNGSPVPQPSNSVTKLSITNKSFYNSIYGRNGIAVIENKLGKDHKPLKREIGLSLEGIDEDSENVNTTPLSEKNIKKYIDRSYYLDEAETEIRHVEEDKKSIDLCSTSNSGISADFCANLNLLTLVSPSDSDFTTGDDEAPTNTNLPLKSEAPVEENQEITFKTVDTPNELHVVPSNSPTQINYEENNADKTTTLVECRKSIDKIYDLLHKLGKTQEGSKIPKSKFTANNPENIEITGNIVCSTCPDSDSGTSLKQQSSSYPSAFSFDKCENDNSVQSINHKKETIAVNTPKVIINSKEKKIDRKSPKVKVPDNPLRAISQLLREFENVHKNRQKQNSAKKPDKLPDDKHVTRPNFPRRTLRPDQQHDSHDRNNVKSPKERKPRNATEFSKSGRQSPSEEKNSDKVVKKKITDFIDEAKEARGEAVRGPCKFNSRLNTLAQPKRSYVQAHSEEYQTKYGRNMMANRLQRLATAPPPTIPERNASSAISRNKQKRNGAEPVITGPVKVPSPHNNTPPLERATKARFMTSKPEVKELQPGSSLKHNVRTPETLVQKMSAIETYVNHNGRATSAAALNVETVQRSRVPLVPHDIELGSTSSSPASEVERATELGSRLHYIIDNMLKTELNQTPLEVLPECQESSTNLSKDKNENVSMVQNFSERDQKYKYSEENYEDQFDNSFSLVTVPESEQDFSEKGKISSNVEARVFKHEKQQFKSLTNLEKSQEVSRRLSVGAFQKRLRIKNMTLSPKHSMTHVFVLQSGDTGSLVVKSTISQSNLKKTLNNITELTTTLPSLSKTHLDFNYTQLPMQVATVNYAMIPDYKSNMQSTSLVKLFDGSLRNKSVRSPSPKDEDTQCNEVRQPKPSEGRVSKETKDTQSDFFMEIRNKLVKFSNTENNSTESPNAIDSYSPPMYESQNQIKDSKESGILAKEENYTSSLDMLMGLLNEIQKISTGQTTMTEGIEVNKDHNELENISSAPSPDDKINRHELISISSLDRLRQLESDPSLYSLFLSDSDQYVRRNFGIGDIPLVIATNSNDFHYDTPYADKEVCVDLTNKEYIDRYTDVPSQIFPLSVSYVTSAVQAEPSVQSMVSCMEFQPKKELKDYNRIQEGVHIPTADLLHIPTPELSFADDIINKIEITNANDKDVTKNAMKTEVDDKCAELRSVSQMNLLKDTDTSLETLSNVNPSVMLCKKIQNLENIDQTRQKSLCILKYGYKKDFDPVMKMKRDILVTVYSILVFTVFAALSFPEVLYLT